MIFFSNLGISQENLISTGVELNRLDYFHSFNYARRLDKFELGAGFAYGINRTIFQQRFFPRFQIQGAYTILQKNKFQLQPTLSLGFSVLKINKQSDKFTNWTEALGGLSWFYGDKWAIGQTFQLGYLVENYYNSISQKRTFVCVWTYSVAVKVRYAF